MRALSWLAALATFAPGCVAQRYVIPEAPPVRAMLEEPPADLTHIALTIKSFDITNQSATDLQSWDKRKEMERSFLAHLHARASIGLFIADRASTEPPDFLEDVQLRVRFNVEETASRTIVFDGLFFYPFVGFFPFTPQWGEAIVTGTIDLERGREKELPVTVRVSAPYSIIFYSWYRVDPIEEAFARAHDKLFDELLARLITRIGVRDRAPPPPAIAATSTVATSTTNLIVLTPPKIDNAQRIAALQASLAKLQASLGSGLPSDVILPPNDVGVIFRPVHRDRDPGFFSQYLAALGGIEASITGGAANVQSRATTSRGDRQTVGTGQATSSGYRFSLFKPPTVTGFFFPPTIGFLSETITIRGFRDDVPLFTPSGSDTIPAVVTDPSTGAPIDAGEPLSYRLKLKSGHVGQGIGLNLVIGDEDVQIFSTVLAGLNLFEIRHSDVTFDTARVKGMSVAAFQSGNFGAQLGLAFPAIHLAVRAAAHIEWYAAFSYPERVEFQAKSVFNPEKMIFERERVFVTGASLTTFDWRLSVVALF